MKNIAWRCAIAVFFLMTLTGWFWGQEPEVCAWRGIIGGIAMYAVVRIVGVVVIEIIIDTMARSEARKMAGGE
jgi:hypothetical protein